MLASIPSMPVTIGKRYQILDKIGSGGMGTVYRAMDRLSNKIVAIKQVLSPTGDLAYLLETDPADMRLALAKEFGTLASLRHPNIISVLDYGFDEEHQPYYTMDLLENSRTILDYGQGQPLDVQINLLIQLLRALAYLHRRAIIHHDLKPANILIVDDQLKVLDFGMSLVRKRDGDQSHGVSGTLAYLAPEILSEIAGPTESSDLYSVGVIAYELFAGHHPFDTDNVTRLVNQVLHEMPNLSTIDVSMATILDRLLAKSPQDRFKDAIEVIQAFSAALNLPLPIETQATRESFLQAADFVGRDEELSQLTQSFQNAVVGQGSFWLISGESGVGKSRLLEELRTRVLVGGALVLRGQAIAEGSDLYHLWRDAVRWLSLNTDLSDFEAGVLKQIAPDIGSLLGRPIPDVSELEPRAMKDRLLSVIEAVFRRQDHPIVLVLEDLQWESESIEILIHLNRIVANLALLIVGSYRAEDNPNLPELLPGTHVLKLERLSSQSIADLAESMLGSSGRASHIVEFLQKETEGNVFFLVEVVRALAEESGQLDKIGLMTLPHRVFAGGIKSVIQRRLSQIPPEGFSLLQWAAVYGRQLDLDILQTVAGIIDLPFWLLTASEANVLDVDEGKWRFAHDKLREELLSELPPAKAQSLHREVAEAIERVYPDSPLQVINLAYHWAMANVPEKELHYTVLAGEAARKSGLDKDALIYFTRALKLDEQVHPGSLQAQDKLNRAHLQVLLGSVYYNTGDFDHNISVTEEALAMLGDAVPSSKPGMTGALVAQLGLQALHRVAPGLFARRTREISILKDMDLAYTTISMAYFFHNKVNSTIYSVVRRLNVTETIGSGAEYGKAASAFGFAMGLIPAHAFAEFYTRRAREIGEALENESGLADIYAQIGAYYAGTERFKEAEHFFDRAIEICDEIGNISISLTAKGIYGWSIVHCDANYRRAFDQYSELYRLAKEYDYKQQQIWGLNGQIQYYRCYTRHEDLDTLIPKIDEGMELLAIHHEPEQWVSFQSVLAMIHLYKGQKQEALKVIRRVEQEIAKIPPVIYTMLSIHNNTAEVFLKLLEDTRTESPEYASLQKSAALACKNLERHARTFPIAKVWAVFWRGFYDYLMGDPDKARQSWQKALTDARRLDLPYQIARVQYYLGRYSNIAESERRAHLKSAHEIFERLGTAYDAEQTKMAIQRLSSTT